MLTEKLTELPINRAVVLDNITCPYCGIGLTSDNDTKEHVIGRRFVPKGLLNGNWNLIVRACSKCNSEKSILENDISAITLASKHWFENAEGNDIVRVEANIKAKNSTSHKTGKPVIHSQEKLNIEVPLGTNASVKFNLIAPPQIDNERLFSLARMQLMAFFYFKTYNRETRKGGFWIGGFYPISEAHYGDWGNSLQKSFMETVFHWDLRWVGNTAEGFFKSIIRKQPKTDCWAWALEWNNNYRITGFFGERDATQKIVDKLLIERVSTIPTGKISSVGFRSEIKLGEEDDILFAWEEDS